jgi:ubiquinone/menaquinone biosynthesis C-methylase UbiE
MSLDVNKISNNKQTYWFKIPFFDKFLVKILLRFREFFFKVFEDNIAYTKDTKVLDIGTTGSITDQDNIFIKKFKYKNNLTCLSDQNLDNLKSIYPEIKCIQSDGRNTYLEDNSFEVVHSNATIEHVGTLDDQINFLKECVRVSKKYVFLQTPNKFFPIEFHTKIPLLHLLPDFIFRNLLKVIGMNYYSDIKNLNLLSHKDLLKFIKILNINDYKIIKCKFFFFTSNLILIIKK